GKCPLPPSPVRRAPSGETGHTGVHATTRPDNIERRGFSATVLRLVSGLWTSRPRLVRYRYTIEPPYIPGHQKCRNETAGSPLCPALNPRCRRTVLVNTTRGPVPRCQGQ